MSKANGNLLYAELVELLRLHLRDGKSGLITGITEKQHSFQIGFEKGEIVFLSYRVLKSLAALERLLLVDSAKIVEHLGTSPPAQQFDLPDSSTIMSRLAMGKFGVASGETTAAADAGVSPASQPGSAPSQPSQDTNQVLMSSGVYAKIDVSQIDAIKRSAVHTFGPFGAMMCDKHLTPSSLASADLRTILTRIAQDLGASDTDTKTFINQVIR
jgi:hypothetical protein